MEWNAWHTRDSINFLLLIGNIAWDAWSVSPVYYTIRELLTVFLISFDNTRDSMHLRVDYGGMIRKSQNKSRPSLSSGKLEKCCTYPHIIIKMVITVLSECLRVYFHSWLHGIRCVHSTIVCRLYLVQETVIINKARIRADYLACFMDIISINSPIEFIQFLNLYSVIVMETVNT